MDIKTAKISIDAILECLTEKERERVISSFGKIRADKKPPKKLTKDWAYRDTFNHF